MVTPPPRWPRSSPASKPATPGVASSGPSFRSARSLSAGGAVCSDFRAQGYALASIGAVATSIYLPYPAISLAVASAVAYAFVHMTLWSGADRFDQGERDALRVAASCVTTLGVCTLVWRLVPGEYLGIAWLALALLLLEAGLRELPGEFRVLALIVGVLGAARVVGFDLSNRLALVASGLTYAFALRAAKKPMAASSMSPPGQPPSSSWPDFTPYCRLGRQPRLGAGRARAC